MADKNVITIKFGASSFYAKLTTDEFAKVIDFVYALSTSSDKEGEY